MQDSSARRGRLGGSWELWAPWVSGERKKVGERVESGNHHSAIPFSCRRRHVGQKRSKGPKRARTILDNEVNEDESTIERERERGKERERKGDG